MIYLDAASTAKYRNVDDIIVDTMTTAMRDSWLNPSSLYASNIKDKISKCRSNIAEFIGAKADEIIFTSGASESNNMAIKGWIYENDLVTINKHRENLISPHVITTPIEHKSILELINNLWRNCTQTHFCKVNEYGEVIYESLEELLEAYKDEPILVSVGMANNEIGTLQDVKKLSSLVHKYNGVLHVDATQALNYIPINVEALGIDILSASGHKISPVLRGIGFLYKKNDVNIQPLIYGSQEFGLRGGTEFTYGIIGLNKALEYCDVSEEKIRKMQSTRDHFIGMLKSKFGCTLNGHDANRLPNNINATFPQNITGESLLYMLDMSGIVISTGSACNSKSIEPSHVLKAIGLTDEQAMRTVRFSIPEDITYQDIDRVIEEIDKCIKLIESN